MTSNNRPRPPYLPRWIVALALMASQFSSGCYLNWPDRSVSDSSLDQNVGTDQRISDAKVDGAIVDLSVDQAVDAKVGDLPAVACKLPSDCATSPGPACSGVWACEKNTCVFKCASCTTDGDKDNYGAGDGCIDWDCDDKKKTVNPGQSEICDGFDNNCNGQVDENLGTLTCGHGACRVTIAACVAGKPQTCAALAPTQKEICDNGLDDDCDGQIDENCGCKAGSRQACLSGKGPIAGLKGDCKAGQQTCQSGEWGDCVGEVGPAPEVCDGVDNDCDGTIDDDLLVPRCSLIVGVCRSAAPLCNGKLGWGQCSCGGAFVANESDCDAKDNDCDGLIDEGCGCTIAGQVRPCGSSVGACRTGKQRCAGGKWSLCVGETPNVAERCDGVDNDCDGLVDEDFDADGDGFTSCGTAVGGGIDLARKDCDDKDPLAHPGAKEVCDGIDNDCDQKKDEATTPSSSGQEVDWGACQCGNGVDDDGDGSVDHGADPGCKTKGDNDELSATACDDGVDNDKDGKVDFRPTGGDPECTSPADKSETCKAHSECNGGLCTKDGVCIAATAVTHVDVNCGGTRTGSATQPYCAINDAVGKSHRYVLVRKGKYTQTTLDKDHDVYGEPGAIIHDAGAGCAALKITASNVLVHGFTIGTGKNGQGGVAISNTTGTTTLIKNDIGPSTCVGVSTSKADSRPTLRQNYVHDNTDGGVSIDDGINIELSNNIIVNNGNASLNFGGVMLKLKSGSAKFINNTVADNISKGNNGDEAGGVRCDNAITLTNTILWGNTKATTGEQYGSKCTPTFCDLQTTATVSGGNIKTAPDFVGGTKSAAYYHLKSTSKCKNKGTAIGAPTIDYDGQSRDDGKPDIGADEL